LGWVGLLQCIKAHCAGILAVGLTGLPLDCSKLAYYGLLQLAPLITPLPSVVPTPPSLKGFARDHQGTSTDPKNGSTGNRTHHLRNVVIETIKGDQRAQRCRYVSLVPRRGVGWLLHSLGTCIGRRLLA
jgi:hypothetical protein